MIARTRRDPPLKLRTYLLTPQKGISAAHRAWSIMVRAADHGNGDRAVLAHVKARAMNNKVRLILLGAALLGSLSPAIAEAATQRCIGQAHSADGSAAAVAAMDLQDGLMKSMILVLSRRASAVPGLGAAAGAPVQIQFDEKLTMGDQQIFDGLGVYLTFPNHAITGPIDLMVTIGAIEAGIDGLVAEPDGSYFVRLGAGPLKGNKLATAVDKVTVARVKAVMSKAKDQVLVDSDAALGTVKEREDVGLAAMDQAEKKAKTNC